MKNARVCVVSLRGANKHAAWCSNYEFEDVICEIDDVDLYTLNPSNHFQTRQWLARRLVWRKGLRELTRHVNPGLETIALDKDYDLFVFICMNPADLIYLSAIKGWTDRCRTSVCLMVEFYKGWLNEYAFHLSLLQGFAHLALCFSGSVEPVAKGIGMPCHHVPLGTDVLRFTPYPNPPARCIDVYSMGRRSETIHAALLKMVERRGIFYLYDTIPGLLVQPHDHRQHRDLLANCGRRAKYFVTYPAKVDAADETRGQSEVGARFFEGAATGAVLVGQAPTTPAFARDFEWPDSVVDVGTSEDSLADALSHFERHPDERAALGRRNALEAIRRFDWAYRWRDLLSIAGLQPLRRLDERLGRLNALATLAESEILQS